MDDEAVYLLSPVKFISIAVKPETDTPAALLGVDDEGRLWCQALCEGAVWIEITDLPKKRTLLI
jgi:hypothetical protein